MERLHFVLALLATLIDVSLAGCLDDDKKVEQAGGPPTCAWLARAYPNGDGQCAENHPLGQHCRLSCGHCAGDLVNSEDSMDSDDIRLDLFTNGYGTGGPQTYIGVKSSEIECLRACHNKKDAGDKRVNGMDFGVKSKKCYCNKGATKVVDHGLWRTSFLVPVNSDPIRLDKLADAALEGGRKVPIEYQLSPTACLQACYLRKLSGISDINGAMASKSGKKRTCYCVKGGYSIQKQTGWMASFIVPVKEEKIHMDKFQVGYMSGGYQLKIESQPSAATCLQACHTRKVSGIDTINGADYRTSKKECWCNKGAYTRVNKAGYQTSFLLHYPECNTVSGPEKGAVCLFPFVYSSTTYDECTNVENNGKQWCPTKLNNGNYINGKWGNCNKSCDADKIHHDKYEIGYLAGGSKIKIPHQDSMLSCLKACHVRRLSGISTINGAYFYASNRNKKRKDCFCTKGAYEIKRTKSVEYKFSFMLPTGKEEKIHLDLFKDGYGYGYSHRQIENHLNERACLEACHIRRLSGMTEFKGADYRAKTKTCYCNMGLKTIKKRAGWRTSPLLHEGEPTPAPPTQPPTKAPTTKAPTTKAPTTKAPTTKAPTTKAPTTKAPTTKAPTTTEPPTDAPTDAPTEAPTEPPTDAPTDAPTEPPTDAPTEPATVQCGNSLKLRDGGCPQWDTVRIEKYDYSPEITCTQRCKENPACAGFVQKKRNKKCFLVRDGCTQGGQRNKFEYYQYNRCPANLCNGVPLKDKYTRCKTWKEQGKCEDSAYSSILSYCKKSCNYCPEDSNKK